MRKKIFGIIAAIFLAIASIAGVGYAVFSGFSYILMENADYYGCPNSKRIKRLNLKKQIIESIRRG